MNIKKIKLQNFKCFEAVEIDCAKVTLLTGANSSGKSSLLNGLLGALQTARYPLFYSPNGDYVNMGDYSEIVFNHIRHGDIGITLEFDHPSGTSVFDSSFSEHPKTRQPRLKRLNFANPEFKLSLQMVNSQYEGSYSYVPKLGGQEETSRQMQKILTKFMSEMVGVVGDIPRNKRAKPFMPPDLAKEMFEPSQGKVKLSIQFEVGIPEGREFLVHSQIASMTSAVSGMNQQFNYISSFRHPPERTYYRKTKGALKVGRYGENHIDQVIDWEQSRSKKFRALVRSLQQLTLLSEIHTKMFHGGRFDIKVKPSNKSIPTSLIDVGFGVSQLLPIVAADLQLKEGGTLAISQPEIHLHPSAQSLLGEYFSRNAIENKKRYIVETHSEYLVNKFRALIAKGDLKPEDVSVYYLRKNSSATECFPIVFTKDGKTEGAPKDFFDTYMCDVMEIALNS